MHRHAVEGTLPISPTVEERKHINHQDILGLTPLHYFIISAEDPYVMGVLAAGGAEMNATDIRGRTPLHYLCRKDMHTYVAEHIVIQMLKSGAKIDVQDVDGVAPLHLAALHNLESPARLLLEAGANFNLADNIGYSPLLWAARGGAIQVAKLLLERLGQEGLAEKLGRIRDDYGRTILHVAAMSDQVSFIDLLISSCDLSNLEEKEDRFGNLPIHLAAQAGKENAVKQLLDLESDSRALEKNGKSPTHLAAENGQTKSVHILFNADGNATDLPVNDFGETPLHLAAIARKKKIVELLLDFKPHSRRIPGRFGVTALDCAAREGYNDMIDLLFEDQDRKKCDNKMTPLHFAAQGGHIDTVKLLVEKGASVTSVTIFYETPLDIAIAGGHEGIVQFFLGQPDVRLEDKYGNTLLHAAACYGRVNISRLIIDVKKEQIDVNSTNTDGNTPLHLAAEEGHSGMVDFLIDVCKCDKTRPNNAGCKPLDVAEKNGQQDVVDLLVNKFGLKRHVSDELDEEDAL